MRCASFSRNGRPLEHEHSCTDEQASGRSPGRSNREKAPRRGLGAGRSRRVLRSDRGGIVLRACGQGGLLRALDARGLRLPMTGAPTPVADAVWRELHDRLWSFIARRVRSPQDAEDILQEVMLRIHRHSGDLEHADRVASWVYRIAANSVTDHYRRSVRRELASGQATDIDEPAGATAASAWTEPDSEELRAELAGCLAPLTARLPPLYREALEVTEFQGMTQAEAASRLGLSVSGMKARVQRGREQLKELLLDCCEVELDRRGGVTAYRSKRGSCATCGRR